MSVKKIGIAIGIVASLAAAGCTTTQDQNTYSRNEVYGVQDVYYGTIMGLRPVNIEGTKTPIGALAGGAIGGLAGSTIGGGKGSYVTAIIGAVGGGLLGAKGEEYFTSSNGVEITVQGDDGRTRAFVQAVNENERFRVGDRVKVTGNMGKYRVSY